MKLIRIEKQEKSINKNKKAKKRNCEKLKNKKNLIKIQVRKFEKESYNINNIIKVIK